MNKNIVLAGFAATIITASLTAPLAASAARSSEGTIKATTSCGEIKVTLKGFANAPKSNTKVIAKLDGITVVDYKFTTTYSFTFYVDNRSAHTVNVKVTDRNGTAATKTVQMAPCSYGS